MLNNDKEAADYLASIKEAFDPECRPYRLLTGRDTADLLGISYNSFKNDIANNPSLPRIRVGKQFKYPRQCVIEWVASISKSWYEY